MSFVLSHFFKTRYKYIYLYIYDYSPLRKYVHHTLMNTSERLDRLDLENYEVGH
jgi:hypothetical protein